MVRTTARPTYARRARMRDGPGAHTPAPTAETFHTPRAGIARACPKRGPMQRRSLAAAIGIVIVTLACVCGLYVHFIQEKVHDESADHLKEI